ncbi:MAG: hypothetical protein M0P74_06165 [Syntrophales bacterium]|jgi:hypothetical protein|nr:hypothetical protein [Syntrophales bacterium]
MAETVKTIFMFLLLIAALILILRVTGWKMKRAADAIVADLRKKQAFDPASARELPYSKVELFHVGLRDYRPKALSALVRQDVVRMIEGGKYYLREGQASGISGEAAPGEKDLQS